MFKWVLSSISPKRGWKPSPITYIPSFGLEDGFFWVIFSKPIPHFKQNSLFHYDIFTYMLRNHTHMS